MDIKFENLLAIIRWCLMIQLLDIVQFHPYMGPLVSIVFKMIRDFIWFTVLYVLLITMFALIGLINFNTDLQQYRSLFEAFMTVLDISVGNYDFNDFLTLKLKAFTARLGTLYTMLILVVFQILMLNLIIAVLSNTYHRFNTKARGLYLSKILEERNSTFYDLHYGSFLIALVPMNFLMIPLIPFALIRKPPINMNRILTFM